MGGGRRGREPRRMTASKYVCMLLTAHECYPHTQLVRSEAGKGGREDERDVEWCGVWGR